MSDAAYSAKVDSYLAEGMELGEAISRAAADDAQYKDPFLVMKQDAIDNGKML